jgi:hypothetical protein
MLGLKKAPYYANSIAGIMCVPLGKTIHAIPTTKNSMLSLDISESNKDVHPNFFRTGFQQADASEQDIQAFF